jgi:hypothetical protein
MILILPREQRFGSSRSLVWRCHYPWAYVSNDADRVYAVYVSKEVHTVCQLAGTCIGLVLVVFDIYAVATMFFMMVATCFCIL